MIINNLVYFILGAAFAIVFYRIAYLNGSFKIDDEHDKYRLCISKEAKLYKRRYILFRIDKNVDLTQK